MKAIGAFLVLVLVVYNASASGDCFAPKAAFSLKGDTYLIDGNKFVALDGALKESRSGTIEEAYGVSGDIKAALVLTYGYPHIYSISFNVGDNIAQYYADKNNVEITCPAKDWGPFFENGFDAGTQLGDKVYYFKGCRYTNLIYQSGSYMTDLGIPVCDVDAAFTYDGSLYVIKGAEYWVMDENESAQGPKPLEELVKLTSNSLCPKVLSYEEKVEAEKKYEADHNCVIIDSAFFRDDRLYLVNDDEYCALPKMWEYWVMPLKGWGVYADRVEAAVGSAGDGNTHFFEGAHNYRYLSGNEAYGPKSIAKWSSFLAQGIDASASISGLSFFFKGCEVAAHGVEPKSLVDLGIPCDLHAAYSKGNQIYVIKYNQVWKWPGGNSKASGPYSLSSFISLRSWTICSKP